MVGFYQFVYKSIIVYVSSVNGVYQLSANIVFLLIRRLLKFTSSRTKQITSLDVFRRCFVFNIMHLFATVTGSPLPQLFVGTRKAAALVRHTPTYYYYHYYYYYYYYYYYTAYVNKNKLMNPTILHR